MKCWDFEANTETPRAEKDDQDLEGRHFRRGNSEHMTTMRLWAGLTRW